MIYPNILVISSNAFSKNQNNGKTLECLLKKWPIEKIAHIYFDGKKEDIDFCEKFFYLSVYDATDRILSLQRKDYIVSEKSPLGFEKRKIEDYTSLVKKIYMSMKSNANDENVVQKMRSEVKARSPKTKIIEMPFLCVRRWIEKEVDEWLKDYRPELIVFQTTSEFLPFIIAQYIKDKYNIPMVTQVLDDFTKPIYQNSVIERLIVNKYNKFLKKCISESVAVITISKLMAKEYKKNFGGKKYFVFSNASDFACKEKNDYKLKSKIVILYTGNLGHERINVLLRLGRVLNVINKKDNYQIILRVYSATELTFEQKSEIKKCASIDYRGYVSPSKLPQEIERADFLLHVESFSPIYRRMVRLSISTKIGEYLSSNRCILAIGPKEVASIDYIKSNELGFVIDNEEFDEKRIEEMISDEKRINRYIENARAEYENRFTDIKVQEIMNKIVSEI